MSHAANLDGNLAALNAYHREQDMREVSERAWDKAKVKYALSNLRADPRRYDRDASAIEYVNGLWTEAPGNELVAIAAVIAEGLDGSDSIQDAEPDLTELGRLVWRMLQRRMDIEAEGFAEDYLPRMEDAA